MKTLWKDKSVTDFEITGDVISLRPIRKQDDCQLLFWRSKKMNYQYFYSAIPLTKTKLTIWHEKYLNDTNSLVFMIILQRNNKQIGTISITISESNIAEIGYMIGDIEYRGKGLAGLAVDLAINYLRKIGIRCIQAGCHCDNKASIAILLNRGFTYFKQNENFRYYRLIMNETKPTLYVRLDLNKSIGMGHFRRCESIINGVNSIIEVKAIYLISKDSDPEELIRSNKTYIRLTTEHNNIDSEITEMLGLNHGVQRALLLLDNYNVTEEYLHEIRTKFYVIMLDDIPRFDYSVDCLINYNLYANTLHYTKADHLLLGPQYIPLREQFAGKTVKIHKQIKKILLTTGGSDSLNLMDHFLNELSTDFSEYEYHAVLGSLFNNKNSIMAKYKSKINIIFHNNVEDMAELMCQCDLAIAACGSTIYELMSVGLPSICYILADNQIKIADYLFNNDIFPFVGDARTSIDELIFKIENQILMLEDMNCRVRISNNCKHYLPLDKSNTLAKQITKLILLERQETSD